MYGSYGMSPLMEQLLLEQLGHRKTGGTDLNDAIRFLQKLEKKRLKKEEEAKKKKEPKPINIPVGVCMFWITLLSLPVGIGQLWLIKYLGHVLQQM